MKLLDGQGRLWGRLNLIDFLVIAMVAAVAFFAAPKLIGADPVDGELRLRYTVWAEAVTPETYASVAGNIPSRLMASGTLVDGYVVAAEAKPHAIFTEDERGRIIFAEDERLLDVTFTIETTVPRREVLLNTVGTQEIRIGRDHYLKTELFEFMGPITTAEWTELPAGETPPQSRG